jgi:PPOX class probable F420-dependent enzyme
MTFRERETLLTEPGMICRIATVQLGGSPHVTPVWFIYEDGQIYVTPRAESSWLSNIRRNPRVALTIDENPHPYRKVTVEGEARIVHDLGEDELWRDQYRRIAERYTSPEGARAYIQRTIDQPRALLAVAIEASVVRTWRMPIEGEPGTGIWHERYYLPGTLMADDAQRSKESNSKPPTPP